MISDKKKSTEAKKELELAKSANEIVQILDKYKEYKLGPSPLGVAFEKLYVSQQGYSKPVIINDLIALHPAYRTTNGGDWCRSDNSYLGKKYYIIREKKSGSIYSVKIDGPNKGIIIDSSIRNDILKEIKSKNCVILDITTNIECDHKDGQKNDGRVGDKEKQVIDDFQPLCKTANDAKRTHCKHCKSTGKRYDAKRLGYKVSYTFGDENSKTCVGCYWYDPIEFNKEISKDFVKSDE